MKARQWAVFALVLIVAGCAAPTKRGDPGTPTRGGSTQPSGDYSSQPEPPAPPSGTPTYKVGNPYTVGGVTYVPREDPTYDRMGIASWYGPNFHGRRTANGEIFDQNLVSAAHTTLPMPSHVRVTNLENGRSLIARVNDRGPFSRGRIIDMSRRAAQLLGFEGQGTAKVRVQYAGPAPLEPGQDVPARATQPVQMVPVSPTSIYVQAGAFSIEGNAVNLRNRLKWIAPTFITVIQVDGTRFYRVRLGPLSTVAEADRVLSEVVSAGQGEARILVDEWSR
ncbi:MAG: septal ring lytic transglycosylase RlpA family protein [Alphaproteobacteria bacterium]|nr:septal ring lytic transglycosylase RlpA family protein [Alphaproteobacteria bacterium]